MPVIASVKKVISVLFTLTILHGIHPAMSQGTKGIITGTVKDGTTYKALFGVSVTEEGRQSLYTTNTAGEYILKLSKGNKSISFSLKGFQTKIVNQVKLGANELKKIDIILLPISTSDIKVLKKTGKTDSLNKTDELLKISLLKEQASDIYLSSAIGAVAQMQTVISEKNSLNTGFAGTIKKLNGIGLFNFLGPLQPANLTIEGLGDRYNLVLLNGAVFESFDQYSRAYPLDMIPAESVEKVTLVKSADATLPGDYAGGSLSIVTKDEPVENFLYLRAGGNVYDKNRDIDFYSSKRNTGSFFAMPGDVNKLPSSFPATRSPVAFNQLNLQEQIFYSKQLSNNLAPINYGHSGINNKFSTGFGKIFQLKKVIKLTISGSIFQQKAEQIAVNTAQVAVNAAGNPYPFINTKNLVGSSSYDSNYIYAAQSGAVLNTTLQFRNNKIALKSIFSSQLTNTFVRRSAVSAPDTDPSADAGIYYNTAERKFFNVQLSGVHALGADNKLKLDWQATYSYYRQQNPDEKNFILKSDTTGNNTFEIGAGNSVNDITGISRMWRTLAEHSYTGAFNISFPFNMFKQAQLLSGGIMINTRYRVFRSDLLLAKGAGYYQLQDLLAADRYYPGGEGLSVTNYYSNKPASSDLNDRANYVASANLGAVHLQLNNNISKRLTVKWGIRAESNSQLVSSTAYDYTIGYQYPRLRTLDQNLTVGKFSLLPSAFLNYRLLKSVNLYAAAYRTLNRPQLQELSVYRYYDPVSFSISTGNQHLKSSHIENYKAGFTWAATKLSYISIAAFYKKIDQPIENILSSYGAATILNKPYNAPPATVKGITADASMNLLESTSNWLKAINIFAGGTYADATVEAGPLKSFTTPSVVAHTLSGTPEYSYNGGLIFSLKKAPQLTILYNGNSGYITSVGSGSVVTLSNGNEITALPNYRVSKNEQLDIHLSCALFGQKLQVAAGVNNLLNGTYTIYQDLNGNKKMDDPLVTGSFNGKPGYYRSGTDNTISSIKTQKNYFITVYFLFR